jgi:hypothetical protein
MAFQAKLGHSVSGQQFGIVRTVRFMTGSATFHAQGGMLINKRPPFVGVAFHTSHFISIGQTHLPRIQTTVGLMTIHTMNRPLVEAMPVRLVKGNQVVPMTADTELI